MAAPLTEAAIAKMREMIVERRAGARAPGCRRRPTSPTLLGASRNTVREAVRALVTAHVLDVRRGDGTYVTSLRPELLLEGIGAAVELMQEGFSLELIARSADPGAGRDRARRGPDRRRGARELGGYLQRMREAASEAERIEHDAEFHRLVAAASGNETLASMLSAVSSRTMRARAWRGVAEEGAGARTVSPAPGHPRRLDGARPGSGGVGRPGARRDDRGLVPAGRRRASAAGGRARGRGGGEPRRARAPR